MTDASAEHHGALTVFRQLFNLRRAPAAGPRQCSTRRFADGSRGHLAPPGERVSGNTKEPSPSPPLRPLDGHALVARGGFRALAGGAKVE